jgi:hypothetical protein
VLCSWLTFSLHYLWLVATSWLGIALLVVGVLQLGEWVIDKKAPIPQWIRLTALLALLFLAQAAAYKRLVDNPPAPIVLRMTAPAPPIFPPAEKPGAAIATREPTPKSSVQTNSAPNGIAIGGGTVSNPTVNNFAPPQRALSSDQKTALIECPKNNPGKFTIAAVIGSREAYSMLKIGMTYLVGQTGKTSNPFLSPPWR